jgi:hypothetical protein
MGIWRSITALVAAGVLGACLEGENARPLGETCESDDSCTGSLVCRYGRCRPLCTLDRDCAEGEVCVAGQEPPERVCTVPDEHEDGDCPGETVWLVDEAVCRDLCGDEPDRCPQGYHCLETLDGRGVCVDEGIECLLYMAACVAGTSLVHCVDGHLVTESCPQGCEVDMEVGGGFCL